MYWQAAAEANRANIYNNEKSRYIDYNKLLNVSPLYVIFSSHFRERIDNHNNEEGE